MDSKQGTGGGIGLMSILFIVFLVLKLVGAITWSWWWVTAPTWGPLAVVILFFILIVGYAVLVHTFTKH